MDFIPARQNKKWKRKQRQWQKKRQRDKVRIEVQVKATKQQKIVHRHANRFNIRGMSMTSTMQADAFWKNYTAAQEWQVRHNVTWWRSRCMALEHENEVLRNEIRSLVNQFRYPDTATAEANYHKEDINNQEELLYDEDDEELEFTVTEDMLNFFEKSERHRRQLKKKHESNKAVYTEEENLVDLIGGAASARARREDANELYGDASSKILAMETALQATLDNYKDKVNPHFWPNIPLKP
ncbi:gem-associated protein 8 [Harpegnathos saltator]|uniref:Gem-associated protein 8 n=1 Tax=Harpegnathos saltator TaxID=610380 RepID=E2C0G9_HARSA|nr:gem-associated protein 8 [Harpegnathos saltator]EFN78562.1 Gem-associated protein 8 [Harpegnathos saltator]